MSQINPHNQQAGATPYQEDNAAGTVEPFSPVHCTPLSDETTWVSEPRSEILPMEGLEPPVPSLRDRSPPPEPSFLYDGNPDIQHQFPSEQESAPPAYARLYGASHRGAASHAARVQSLGPVPQNRVAGSALASTVTLERGVGWRGCTEAVPDGRTRGERNGAFAYARPAFNFAAARDDAATMFRTDVPASRDPPTEQAEHRMWDFTLDETGNASPRTALGPEEAQWRPTATGQATAGTNDQIQYLMVQLMNRMTDQMASMQARLQPKDPDFTFSGAPTEDPNIFIRRLEDYFYRNRVPPYKYQTYIKKTLTADASSWFREVNNALVDWPTLKSLFLEKFDSIPVRSQLLGELYGKPQQPNERTYSFIAKKWSLFKRLSPGVSDVEKLPIIQELLKPNIRAHTRGLRFTSLQQMLEITTQIDHDLGEAPPTRPAITQSTKQSSQAPKSVTYQPPRDSSQRNSSETIRDNYQGRGQERQMSQRYPEQPWRNQQRPTPPPPSRPVQEQVQRTAPPKEAPRTEERKERVANEGPIQRPRKIPVCYRCGGGHYKNECPQLQAELNQIEVISEGPGQTEVSDSKEGLTKVEDIKGSNKCDSRASCVTGRASVTAANGALTGRTAETHQTGTVMSLDVQRATGKHSRDSHHGIPSKSQIKVKAKSENERSTLMDRSPRVVVTTKAKVKSEPASRSRSPRDRGHTENEPGRYVKRRIPPISVGHETEIKPELSTIKKESVPRNRSPESLKFPLKKHPKYEPLLQGSDKCQKCGGSRSLARQLIKKRVSRQIKVLKCQIGNLKRYRALSLFELGKPYEPGEF